MQISDFDYTLPAELIAQEPLPQRQASRMLAIDRGTSTLTDLVFSDFSALLRDGDVLVLNNTRVFPARLIGQTETGASIELFLVGDHGEFWEALAKPGRRLRVGKRLVFGPRLAAEVIEKRTDGKVRVRFETDEEFFSILDEIGKTPVPPYIKRNPEALDTDRERYQTVFAKTPGAIAAPTAGLHFTPAILEAIALRGIAITEITLHVGYGTFEPVRVDDLEDHKVSSESYSIGDTAAHILNTAKSEGRRVVAVGTTTTRALETNLTKHGDFTPGTELADLTIKPGFRYRAVDALLTNFHLPRSSLLVLTSTFGGHELIMNAYSHAVAQRYRFYSYGDCMFIL